jgi:hypothetical protein
MLVMDWGHTYITVEKLPFAYPVTILNDVTTDAILFPFKSDLVQGQTNITVTYFDQNNNSLSVHFIDLYYRHTNDKTTNNSTLKCFDRDFDNIHS